MYNHVAEELSGEWSDTRGSSIGLKVGNRLKFYKLSSTAIVNYQYTVEPVYNGPVYSGHPVYSH